MHRSAFVHGNVESYHIGQWDKGGNGNMLCTFQLCTFCVPLCTYSMIEKRFFHALYFENGFYRHIERNLRLKKGMDCQNLIRRYRYVLHFSIKCRKFRHFALIGQNLFLELNLPLYLPKLIAPEMIMIEYFCTSMELQSHPKLHQHLDHLYLY